MFDNSSCWLKLRLTEKKNQKLWNKIRYFIRSTSKNSVDYGKKCMKCKFSLYDNLTIEKAIELFNIIIIVRFVFHEGNKYYPQVSLDECLYKI